MSCLNATDAAAGWPHRDRRRERRLVPATSDQPLLEHILASLDDDKAEDIVTIPLEGKSSMADYMVVCSGRSSRQVGGDLRKADRPAQAGDGR